MKQVVFILEFGCYENEHIAGVFSTRQLAEKYMSDSGRSLEADWDDHATITEMELNPSCQKDQK